jgi:AcrR family transcriptional regulator
MTVRLTRPEQTERNRGLVLEAARRVFLERGYAGATLDAIADEAGFTKGVVYSQFAGKPDLMFALIDLRIRERAEANQRVAEELAGADGIMTLLRTNARREATDSDWMRLLMEFRLVAARDPELNARYAAVHEETIERFGQTLEEIAARGGLRLVHGPRHTTLLVFAVAAGVTLEHTASPGALPDEVLEDVFTHITEPI